MCVWTVVVVLSDNHQRAAFESAYGALNNMPNLHDATTGEKHGYFAEGNFVKKKIVCEKNNNNVCEHNKTYTLYLK